MSDGLERIRSAYREGGLSGLASSLTNYVRWRLGGSPVNIPDEPLSERLERTDSAVAVILMRDYYARATPMTRPLISVILPTRDRPDRVARAVESVVGQTYDNWELVVVNDSAAPIPPGVVVQRDNIVVVESGGLGASGARNRGLDTASGELVAFLDDDNLMDPLWLQALAVTIDQAPNATVFIGAQLVTPDPGYNEHHTIRFPPRFEWDVLIRDNFVDMGMLAHRARPDLRFDESLPALVDWDYVVRLTIDTTPALVPAISGLYLTDAPSRISYTDRQNLVEEMRRRFANMKTLEPSLAEQVIGHHDVAALKTMMGRLASMSGELPSLRLASDSPLPRSIADSMIAAGVARLVSGERADVLLTDTVPNSSDVAGTADTGFVIGLTAHRTDYSSIGLEHTRPVGDHLWLGSRRPFNPEDLFDGATLVKFGVADLHD